MAIFFLGISYPLGFVRISGSALDIPLHVQTIVLGGDAKYKADVISNAGFDGALWELNPEQLPDFILEVPNYDFELFGVYRDINSNWDAELAVLEGVETDLVVTLGTGGSDEEVATQIIALAERVSPDGRRIMIYPHTGFRAETSGDVMDILSLVPNQNVGMVFTMPHMMMVHNSRSLEWDFETEFLRALPRVMAFSLCGADSGGSDWNVLIQPLNQGNFDNLSLVKIVLELEYRGPFTLQAYGIPGDPNHHMSASHAAWLDILTGLEQYAGCMDSSYNEFDSEATIHLQERCLVTKIKKSPLKSAVEVRRFPDRNIIEFSGRMAYVGIYNLNGMPVYRSDNLNRTHVQIPDIHSGLYVIHYAPLHGGNKNTLKIYLP